MSKRTKIIIIALAVLVLAVAAYFIFRKKKIQDMQVSQTPGTAPTITSPIGSSGPKWTPNKFPLDVNMQGDYVLALQRALNRINPSNKTAEDGVFGPGTKTKLLLTVSRSQSVLPMSGATWQQIIIDSNK